jgi:hypothetical protein
VSQFLLRTSLCMQGVASLILTNGYPNNKNNKVKSKPLELFELAGKK